MADFLQNNPLLIIAILIGNSLWISLLCYCGLKYWIAKHYSSSNEVAVVTQYVMEPQSGNSYRSEQPFSNVRNVIVIERTSHGPTGSGHHTQIKSLTTADESPEDPPKYSDIFPDLHNISSIPPC